MLPNNFVRANTKQNTFEATHTCHYDEVLTMDVWTSYAPPFAIQEFKKYIRSKYQKNIDIHARRVLAPEEFFDRVRAGITDIISPSHNFLKDERTQLIKNKLVQPLEEHFIPNLKLVNALYLKNNFVTENGELFAIPLAAGGYNLLYDRKHFKTPPTSWAVLWEPENKHRYAISKDFYEANIYITALALGYRGEQIYDINIVDTAPFKLKLRQLLENANFWQGAPKDAELKDSILTTAWGVSHSVSDDPERKWKLTHPHEGVTFWTDYLAVTKNVERNPFAKTMAMEWLNYVLSPEFQERAIVKRRRYMSPLMYDELPRSKYIDKSEMNYLTKNRNFWPILSARNRNGLKLVYDEIMADISNPRIK